MDETNFYLLSPPPGLPVESELPSTDGMETRPGENKHFSFQEKNLEMNTVFLVQEPAGGDHGQSGGGEGVYDFFLR